MRFDTKLVQLGQEPTGPTGDVVPAIHVAACYERRVQEPLRYFYGRGENPTRDGLERCLAGLEDARFATAFSSGQAAAAAVLSLLKPGQRLIASDDLYGGMHPLFARLGRYGIGVEYADLAGPAAPATVAALAKGGTGAVALLWLETPSNPLLKVADVAQLCRWAASCGCRVVVDNTIAGPALQQPLRLGADVTLYSTTKSIAGHSDAMSGALVCNDEHLHREFVSYRTSAGNVPGAFDCFLTHRGLKTLSLRSARQASTAASIVAELRKSDRVGLVHYPGLAEHPQHGLAARQMTAPGPVFSFTCLADPAKLLGRVSLFACAVSLGSVRSLIECPALMTHAPVPAGLRQRLGIPDNLIRVSVGIEDPADLTEDLLRALEG